MALCWPAFASASDTPCKAAVQQRQFVFHAQWANSYNGYRRQLVPPYELKLTAGSIIAYLPYYGRLYSVPTPDEQRFMAIDINSRSYTFRQAKSKRNKQTFTIDLQGHRDIRSLTFSISSSCWGTLTIQSAARDVMMYEGRIEVLRE